MSLAITHIIYLLKAPSNGWEIATSIGTCAVGVGVIFAWLNWLTDRRHRDTEMTIEISRRWDSPEMRRVWAVVRKEQDPMKVLRKAVRAFRLDSSIWYDYELILNFFEDLGALEKRKAVRKVVLEDSIGGLATGIWHIWGPAILELRKVSNQPALYQNFELLAARLRGERLTLGEKINLLFSAAN
jgi:hypothetical protein